MNGPMKLTYKDREHAYWVDGVRYKSVSAVAKIPDDVYNLQQWEKRMVAVGLAMSPHLVERVAAHYNDKQLLGTICDEAKTVAKAYVASGRGTAAHRITERHDLDELVIDTALSLAVRKLWDECLASAGLEVIPEYIERIVVFPEQRVAGRFDRLCRRHSDGRIVVVDLKTGPSAIDYPHQVACQLAMYANAPLMAEPLPAEGGTTSEFEKMPRELDRQTGVVIHMPSEDKAEAVNIDIAAGWNMVHRHIFPILGWRKRTDLAQRTQLIPTVVPKPTDGTDGPGPSLPPLQVVPAPSTSSEGTVEPAGSPSLAPVPSTTAGAQPGVSPPTYEYEPPTPPLARQDRVDWIKMRMKAIRDAGHGDFLRAAWPEDVHNPPTDDDITRIDEACTKVEDIFEMPFHGADPLFASFAQANQDPVIRPVPVPDEFKHIGDTYRHWADKGKQLLADLDDYGLAKAVIETCRIQKGTPMTAELYQRLEAVVNQLTHPEGAVYAVADGPDSWQILASVEHAYNRMIESAGSKVEATKRARRVAIQIGISQPAPTARGFLEAADQPLLAALVAEGHGQA